MNSVRLASVSPVNGGEALSRLRACRSPRDVLQVAVVAANQAAQHAVGIAQVHHQRGDVVLERAHPPSPISG